jgi:hypothetical protein
VLFQSHRHRPCPLAGDQDHGRLHHAGQWFAEAQLQHGRRCLPAPVAGRPGRRASRCSAPRLRCPPDLRCAPGSRHRLGDHTGGLAGPGEPPQVCCGPVPVDHLKAGAHEPANGEPGLGRGTGNPMAGHRARHARRGRSGCLRSDCLRSDYFRSDRPRSSSPEPNPESAVAAPRNTGPGGTAPSRTGPGRTGPGRTGSGRTGSGGTGGGGASSGARGARGRLPGPVPHGQRGRLGPVEGELMGRRPHLGGYLIVERWVERRHRPQPDRWSPTSWRYLDRPHLAHPPILAFAFVCLRQRKSAPDKASRQCFNSCYETRRHPRNVTEGSAQGCPRCPRRPGRPGGSSSPGRPDTGTRGGRVTGITGATGVAGWRVHVRAERHGGAVLSASTRASGTGRVLGAASSGRNVLLDVAGLWPRGRSGRVTPARGRSAGCARPRSPSRRT